MSFRNTKEKLIQSQNCRYLLNWLEEQLKQLQPKLPQKVYAKLVGPLQSTTDDSSDVCLKICQFIEQCRDSELFEIRNFAFSEDTCLRAYLFFLELNEKNQNRCMRRVIALVSTLIACNPDRIVADSVKKAILLRSFSIISHQSEKPLVKPALKSLEYLLSRNSISVDELTKEFEIASQSQSKNLSPDNDKYTRLFGSFIDRIFEWMSFPDTSTTAGKILVTIFYQIKNIPQDMQHKVYQIPSWQIWITKALEKQPNLLENVRNYLLPPLFNLDRRGSVDFLKSLSTETIDHKSHKKSIDTHIIFKLAAFDVGKKIGIVDEPVLIEFHKAPKRLSNSVVIDELVIGTYLIHASNLIRSLSLSVLVSSSSPLRPFSPTTIQLIQSKVPFLFADADVKFRNEILSTIKQLIERLHGSTTFLMRELNFREFQMHNTSNSNPVQQTEAQELLQKTMTLLQSQRSFIQWFFEFLISELIPTASYQRHFISLKTISLWLSSGIVEATDKNCQTKKIKDKILWPFAIDFFTPEVIELLMDLLVDPYEDIRALANSILRMSSSSHFICIKNRSQVEIKVQDPLLVPDICEWSLNFQAKELNYLVVKACLKAKRPLKVLENFINRVEEISNKTGRAYYADGLARSYELLYHLEYLQEDKNKILRNLIEELEIKISLAESNLALAVHDKPLHSNLAALSYIWGSLRIDSSVLNNSSIDTYHPSNFQDKCVEMCRRIWSVVRTILCNDSPEGFLLEDFGESDIIDTKDILSYSFRAIHESSNLLRTIMNKSEYSSVDLARISKSTFISIGNLSFEELSCLRHRGAFSTVSITFATCCKLASHYQPNLLNTWIESAFLCLQTQISTTRRSAGIPSIIIAIMAAMSKNDFEITINKLLKIARNEVKLWSDQEQIPQVHALNSLKEIVKSITTSARVPPYISDCLEVVGQCLNSSVWAIRNSALIFLRSLIDYLVGTNGKSDGFDLGWDEKSLKIRYEKYPALPRILMRLLRNENQEFVDNDAENNTVLPALSIIRRAGPPLEYRYEIYKLVSKLLGSKTWHLRDQGARTLLTLIERGTELEVVGDLVENPGETINNQHGSILTAKLIMLERINIIKFEPDQIDKIYGQILDSRQHLFNPFVLIEYIELINALQELILSHPDFNIGIWRQKFILRLLKTTQIIDELICFQKGVLNAISDPILSLLIYSRGYLKQKSIASIILNNEISILEVIEQAQALSSDLITSVFESILAAFKYNNSKGAYYGIIQAIVQLLTVTEDPDKVCATMSFTSQILEIAGAYLEIGNKLFRNLVEKLEAFISLSPKRSPRLLTSYYAFSGFVCLHKLSDPLLSEDKKNIAIYNWIKSLKRASQENQEFELRYATTIAIQKFYLYYYRVNSAELETKNSLNYYNSELNYILATLLIDDDDDIRKLAASIFSYLKNDCSMCPMAALDSHFKSWVSRNHQSENFGWKCIQNLLIFDDVLSKSDNPVDPSTMLWSARTTDNSLFAVEEPNLFSEPCLILDYFVNAFLQFEFNLEGQQKLLKSNHRSELSILLKWTSSGFEELKGQYRSRAVSIKQYSGPISASIFLALRRIITCGKLVLAYWQKNSQLISQLKNRSTQGKALVSQWEVYRKEITQGLDMIAFQSDMHLSLRKFAARQLVYLA